MLDPLAIRIVLPEISTETSGGHHRQSPSLSVPSETPTLDSQRSLVFQIDQVDFELR
jgi:hypothetical protein